MLPFFSDSVARSVFSITILLEFRQIASVQSDIYHIRRYRQGPRYVKVYNVQLKRLSPVPNNLYFCGKNPLICRYICRSKIEREIDRLTWYVPMSVYFSFISYANRISAVQTTKTSSFSGDRGTEIM